MKKLLAYIIKLKFAPNLSSFLFDFETWARLKPIKRFLGHVDPIVNKRIIDVGAGTGRLELAVNRKDIFIYDHDEESIMEAAKIFPHVKAGTGTKIDFEDNSFDWAISIHTLEHVPEFERTNFLFEMIRISREGIFLNFPEGKYARKLCENFLQALENNGLPPNKWTLEHLDTGLPNIEKLTKVLSEQTKFIFKHKFIRNYHFENYYWKKVKASRSRVVRLVLAPVLAVLSFLFYHRKPAVEVILAGAKTDKLTKKLLRRL